MMLLVKKILVVEDNAINREILREILTPQYQVLEAENGQEALAVLAACKEEVSLILLDIVMPVMDGYTFLGKAKADPDFAAIPVIVTTQSEGESDEVTALAHGAADFVTKPYKPQVILHRVASIINLRETAAMINQVQFDRLTGLYSKEFFARRVREILTQNPDQEFDIIGSDVENFKIYNDVFGIEAGDRLLRGMATHYTKSVGAWGICGRLNGDRFVCLLQHNWDYTEDMFIQAAAQINSIPGGRSVVLKWGIYAIEDKTMDIEQMCDRALLSANSIKGQYGKHFAVYDDALRNKLLREQAITDHMETALADQEFVVYLQPEYRTKDYQLMGAEALVRWNHPTWGLQSPAEFIPLFERNGFISKLDQYVWNRACSYLRDWDDRGLPQIYLSVNVSRADLYQVGIAEILLGIVEKHGLSTDRLHLEITESAYTESPNQIIETVRRLRELGFVIEMDDFGSGYSSLNMLDQMPLDVLKLDMKFIQSETAKPVNQGILRFVMGLTRWMDLRVVAEGVETQDQLERLQELGCDYVQGYYLSRPMQRQDFEALLCRQEPPQQAEPSNQREQGPVARRDKVLLVVDEDPLRRERAAVPFLGRFQVMAAGSRREALVILNDYWYKIAGVVLSMTLPEGEGIAMLEELQQEKTVWNLPVIAAAPWSEDLERRAMALGADDFWDQNHSPESLFRRTLRAMGILAAQERERTLRQTAYQDCLTGLMNRWGLQSAIADIQKEDLPLACYIFDLDDLKQVNDTLGHVQGDQLLKRFAVILRSRIRSSDVLARYGGDEFVVIMKQMKTQENAIQKGEEICRAVRGDGLVRRYEAACSGGIVLCAQREELTDMIERADQALYTAKTSQKGGCCLWES